MIRLRRFVRTEPRDAPYLDVGLQAERTSMAWQRTALGVTGFSALLLHVAGGHTATRAPGMVGFALSLVLLALAEYRYVDSVRRVERSGSPVAPAAVRGVAAIVVALSVSAFVVVLVS